MGDHTDAVISARRVLAEVDPLYRPFGKAALIDTLVQQLPGLVPIPEFFWMESADRTVTTGVGWLEPRQEKGVLVSEQLASPSHELSTHPRRTLLA